jgi:hypothetical protein
MARELGDYEGIAVELALDAERFDTVWAMLDPWLSLQDPAVLTAQKRLGKELVREKADQTKPIGRALARTLLAGAGATGDSDLASTAQALATWVGGSFAADLPKVATFEQRVPLGGLRLRYAAKDVGFAPIHDVHSFGRHLVVALGEAGVAMLSGKGDRVAHFDVPAECLVVSRRNAHLLALATRGEVQRVSRIHLGTRRSEAWTELRLQAFATEFDGEVWPVVVSDTGRGWSPTHLLVLDAADDTPSILHRLPLFEEGSVTRVETNGFYCSVTGAEPFGRFERFSYELPSWTLRERAHVLGSDHDGKSIFIGTFATDGDATAVWQQLATMDETSPAVVSSFTPPTLYMGPLSIELPDGDLSGTPSLALRDGIFAVVLKQERDTRVLAGDFVSRRVTIDIALEQTTGATARLDPPFLLLGDQSGRLMVFDVRTARCVNDLRLR